MWRIFTPKFQKKGQIMFTKLLKVAGVVGLLALMHNLDLAYDCDGKRCNISAQYTQGVQNERG